MPRNFLSFRVKKIPTESLTFYLLVTKYAQQVHCDKNQPIILAPGIYALINSITEKIYLPLRPKKSSGKAVISRFRTPELTYDELVKMGPEPKLTQLSYVNKDTYILEEFYNKYWNLASNDIYKRLKQYIDNILYKRHAFIFTGHGGGGVLATLVAIVFKRHWPNREMILVTYGSPRIGISHLNNWILSAFECARITIGNDHVPLFFGPKYLRHFQLEVWITSNNGCDCFDPEGKEIPDIYICFQLFSRSENKECNLKFEKPKGELPENAMDVHLGPYFGYLMSPQGCKD